MLRSIVAMNDDREIQLPHISPHILRHTAATRLAESGCDIKVMQYLLGQTDIRTTMRVYNPHSLSSCRLPPVYSAFLSIHFTQKQDFL